jgi:phage shock protein PspC (stress-responsive transcriptional regulator)
MSGAFSGLVIALAGRDAYELLGVPPSASPETIKQAYLALMKDWHSDRHPGPAAEEKTKLLNIAWEVLRDHRAGYDELRGTIADDIGAAAQRDEPEAFDDPWLGATPGMAPPPSWPPEPPPSPPQPPPWRPEPPPTPPTSSRQTEPPPAPTPSSRRVPPSSDPRRDPQVNSPQHLSRSRDDRVIAGVCSGVAIYRGIDPAIVRIITAIATMMTFGFVAVIYVIAAIMIPEEGKNTSIAQDLIQQYNAGNRR